jgi:hypothetical protein
LSKSTIKHIKELPSWFKLEKYEAAKSLDAAGWHNNLFVRQVLLKSIGSASFKAALEAEKNIPHLYMDDLDYLRLNPIFQEKLLYILNTFNVGNRKELGIRPVMIGDIYNQIKYIDPDKQSYAHKIIINTDDSESYWDALLHTETKKEWRVNPLLEPLSNNLIHINLELPEKVLIEQFTSFIKKIQYRRSNKKPNFFSWIYFGILPYLDLKIWELETKKKIPNSVMANAIFPPHEGGEEVVRKTTKKIANEILSQSYLHFLECYAANEIAERNEH